MVTWWPATRLPSSLKLFDLSFIYNSYFFCTGKDLFPILTRWRHQTETFFVWLALCVGNSPFSSEFPSQRPVRRCFDFFFDLRLNRRLRYRYNRDIDDLRRHRAHNGVTVMERVNSGNITIKRWFITNDIPTNSMYRHQIKAQKIGHIWWNLYQ